MSSVLKPRPSRAWRGAWYEAGAALKLQSAFSIIEITSNRGVLTGWREKLSAGHMITKAAACLLITSASECKVCAQMCQRLRRLAGDRMANWCGQNFVCFHCGANGYVCIICHTFLLEGMHLCGPYFPSFKFHFRLS